MKFLLSPIGIILIVAILVVVFLPRRSPDVVKKKFGKRPMRAYPDDEASAPEGAERAGAAAKPPAGSPAASEGSPGEPPHAREDA